MGNSSWLIATPEAAALWDGQALQLVEPLPRRAATPGPTDAGRRRPQRW